jgi:hypothetical protein
MWKCVRSKNNIILQKIIGTLYSIFLLFAHYLVTGSTTVLDTHPQKLAQAYMIVIISCFLKKKSKKHTHAQ